MSLIFAFEELFLLVVFFLILFYLRRRPACYPPFYSSLTPVGPMALFKNPSQFCDTARKTLTSDVFSCHFFGGQITFVFGESNVKQVMMAPNSKLNFEEALQIFLGTAFGDGMLTAHTVGPQVTVLKKYLKQECLDRYITCSQVLITDLISKRTSQSGEMNIQSFLRELTFQCGSRNFLGDDFLKVLPEYDYDKIFEGFDIGLRILVQFLPAFVLNYKNKCDRETPPNFFESTVLQLKKDKEGIENPSNMFEELVKRHVEPDGPTSADDKVFTNLIKLFVFGSSFNIYNVICFVVREIVKDPKLWSQLQAEQRNVIDKHGSNLTSVCFEDMNALTLHIDRIGAENAFPFLLRVVKSDFQLGKYVIPAGSRIAFSPKAETQTFVFGYGVHACPARRYARNSMLTIISMLLRHFQFVVKEAPPVKNKRLITFSTQADIIADYVRL